MSVRNTSCKRVKFSTWTDPSFQRHCRFRPTTWEVGQAKDLSAHQSTVVIKNSANSLGIAFSGCSFHRQNMVDGNVRLLQEYVFLDGASKETAHWLVQVGCGLQWGNWQFCHTSKKESNASLFLTYSMWCLIEQLTVMPIQVNCIVSYMIKHSAVVMASGSSFEDDGN